MKVTVYTLHPGSDVEKVWEALEGLGCSLLYSESEENVHTLYGTPLPKKMQKKITGTLPEIKAVAEGSLPEIDWDAQWKEHGVGYQDGCLDVDLTGCLPARHGNPHFLPLKLIPGPGFGDLSHPTTRLVLKLMGEYVQGKNVLDIGCGSGILSLAALRMGAEAVYGLDIDEEAVAHSNKNAATNGLSGEVRFLLPDQASSLIPEGTYVALMNMIQSEQAAAWKSMEPWHHSVDLAVTSGILLEGRDDYLELCRGWGWSLVKEQEEDGWLGFVFLLRSS